MKILKGISAASGINRGTICLYSSEAEGKIPHYAIDPSQVGREKERLHAAIVDARTEMDRMVNIARDQDDMQAADIFSTHLMILNDASLVDKIAELIETHLVNSEHAVNDIFDKYIKSYQEKKGHFRELTHDFVDTRNRILGGFNVVVSKFKCEIGEERPVIVAAKRLTPSMVLNIPRNRVLAFVAEEGGFTSHAVILARSYNVPIIFGINVDQELDCGMQAVVDGSLGKVIVDPDKETTDYYVRKIETISKKKNICLVNQELLARTMTGRRIPLKLNISTPDEMEVARQLPHDGVGLLRTEFLFMQRSEPPSEEEQFEMYRGILGTQPEKPVTVRLLDISSDKMPQFLQLREEIDPDLELRGAMAVETFSHLFVSQVKALLRANEHGNLRLLYPMVSDLSDLDTFRKIVAEAIATLKKEKVPYNEVKIPEGIMVETPAAVMMIDELLKKIDFINIGSNDLLQYTLAAARGNMLAEKRYHILHPALARMMELLARKVKKAKKEVCLCGEIASFEEFYPLFLQLGLESFSVAASKFNDIKCELMLVKRSRGKALVNEFMACANKEEADRFFAKFI